MKFKDTGFRAVYHNYCLIELNDNIKKVLDEIPGNKDINGVLAYGYYDREAGLSLEILAKAIIKEKGFSYAAVKSDITLKLRAEAIEDTEFYVIPDKDGILAAEFTDKLEMLKNYDATEEINKTREMHFLDSCRDSFFIDDVRVRLMRDGFHTEECWTRITGLGDHWFFGTLLNEPFQDFGRHEGDEIAFFLQKTDNDEVFCYADLNSPIKFTEEGLADGVILKVAVERLKKEPDNSKFVTVLNILRDSYVWVPCTAVLNETDKEMVENILKQNEGDYKKLVGQEFTLGNQVRLIPDILQNGDDYFFPVFSSKDEMGEYGNGFSKVEKHMLEVISLAKNNEKKVAGIVVNAFSDSFVLDADLFEVVEEMKSMIQET